MTISTDWEETVNMLTRLSIPYTINHEDPDNLFISLNAVLKFKNNGEHVNSSPSVHKAKRQGRIAARQSMIRKSMREMEEEHKGDASIASYEENQKLSDLMGEAKEMAAQGRAKRRLEAYQKAGLPDIGCVG